MWDLLLQVNIFKTLKYLWWQIQKEKKVVWIIFFLSISKKHIFFVTWFGICLYWYTNNGNTLMNTYFPSRFGSVLICRWAGMFNTHPTHTLGEFAYFQLCYPPVRTYTRQVMKMLSFIMNKIRIYIFFKFTAFGGHNTLITKYIQISFFFPSIPNLTKWCMLRNASIISCLNNSHLNWLAKKSGPLLSWC